MIFSLAKRQQTGSVTMMEQAAARERLHIDVCGRTWAIERLGDLETLWANLGQGEFGQDERIPYWSELWPASLLLCAWLEENRRAVSGKTCLDLGCGLGLTAIVAASFGARVLGMDYEPQALRYARGNAELNNVGQPLWTAMDWRAPALKPGSIDFMWGGDIIYERRFFEPLRELFAHALAPHGRIWLGEPQRSVSLPAWQWLAENGWNVRKIVTRPVPTEGYSVTVNLWELSRAGCF